MARRAIVDYIAWYNGTGLHSTLCYRSLAESEEAGKIKKVALPSHQPCPSKRGNPIRTEVAYARAYAPYGVPWLWRRPVLHEGEAPGSGRSAVQTAVAGVSAREGL
jgi:hypothetical protein